MKQLIRKCWPCRWCPIKEAPYLLRDDNAELKMDTSDPAKLNPDIMPVGTVREFLVCSFNKAVNCDCIEQAAYNSLSKLFRQCVVIPLLKQAC